MRKKKAIKNILFSLLLQIVTIICGFITPALIIKNYGSNVNGLVSSITQFLSYVTFLEAGVGPVLKAALYKPIAKNDKEEVYALLRTGKNYFRNISYIFIVYIFLLAIIYPFVVSNQFDFFYTASLIVIISISTFFEYYVGIIYRIYLNASQNTYVISCIQLVTLIINTIFVVVLIKLGFSIHIVKLVTTLIFVLRPILQYIYAKKVEKIEFSNKGCESTISNKWDGLSQHIASSIHTNTDVSVLTLFCRDITLVSVYSVYYLVVAGIRQFIRSFTSSIDSSFGDMLSRGELENLNKKFNLYETGYFILISIVYLCTLILIVPFVSAYTYGVNDVNYIEYSFAYLLVLGEFIWAIRQPYNELIKASGHFKETKIGAWVEAISNIIISILMVKKFGLIGVAIGTFISILIRTIEFIYHVNKHILKRSNYISIKKIILILAEIISIFIFIHFKSIPLTYSYIKWFKEALIVFGCISIIVIFVNICFYFNDIKGILNLFKKKSK
jgi:O-antigen/teichoic acid export membrane protein